MGALYCLVIYSCIQFGEIAVLEEFSEISPNTSNKFKKLNQIVDISAITNTIILKSVLPQTVPLAKSAPVKLADDDVCKLTILLKYLNQTILLKKKLFFQNSNSKTPVDLDKVEYFS